MNCGQHCRVFGGKTPTLRHQYLRRAIWELVVSKIRYRSEVDGVCHNGSQTNSAQATVRTRIYFYLYINSVFERSVPVS